MKHIVKEINLDTNVVIDIHVFDSATDAIDYAMEMNELMVATPIRFRYARTIEAERTKKR